MDDENKGYMTRLMELFAQDESLTLEEAKVKLHENAYIRPAIETIARYCEMDVNDTDRLRERITDLYIETNPSLKRENVERNVRNWINKKTQVINRKNAIQLAFALNLPIEDADNMLSRLCGDKLHWRTPEDIVWIFAIRNKLSYLQACALAERMAPLCKLPKGAIDNQSVYTDNVKRDVEKLHTEKELVSFLKDSAASLGKFHNTAYSLYCDFMQLLTKECTIDSLPGERKMQTREILETYLYNNLIPRGKMEKGKKQPKDELLKDAIQRDIRLNWPDEFVLSRMTKREIDVSRKVLILLFLACNGGESKYMDLSLTEAEDIYDDMKTRLEAMLADCGFALLDSRIPFDWMVLYSMAVGDVLEVDEKISSFLSEIFQISEDEDPEM